MASPQTIMRYPTNFLLLTQLLELGSGNTRSWRPRRKCHFDGSIPAIARRRSSHNNTNYTMKGNIGAHDHAT